MSTPPTSYGYGERPPLQGFRRSFTAPHRKPSYHEKAALDTSDADANIWYKHPAAKILVFFPPTDSIPKDTKDIPPDTDYPIDTVESLPWASTGETTLASGELKIEKVRGSTNFIKCGHVDQPVLRNSQCWCVDNVSRFVLRVGKLKYYRIELPAASPEDKARVEELQGVLKKILKYETTPCPFKRGFHVELPESAITPRRKGTWKRKEGSLPSTPLTEGSRIPQLRSSRTWSRRAVSDGPVADHQAAASRTDSGYAESPLARRSQIPIASGSEERSPSPSSVGSSDAMNGSREFDQESDAAASDRDDLQSHSSEEPEPEQQSEEIEAENNGHQLNGQFQREELEREIEAADTLSEAEPQNSELEPASHNSIPNDDEMAPPEPDSVGLPDTAQDSNLLHGEDTVESEQTVSVEQALLKATSQTADRQIDVDEIATDHSTTTEPAQLEEDGKDERLNPAVAVGAETQSEPPPVAVEEHLEPAEDLEPLDSFEPLVQVNSRQEDALSTVSSVDSFHTFASADDRSPVLEPRHLIDDDRTPLAERHDPMAISGGQHKREISELTVTASSPRSTGDDTGIDRPSTPQLLTSSMSDLSWVDLPTPSSPAIQEGVRHRLKSRRSLSPLPPQSTIFAPAQHQSQGNHLTSAILQKACNLALVKPIEVVVLLVHILARIAGGATVNDLMSGDLFKKPDQNHRRNTSLPDQIDGRRDDNTDEDDFGIPIRGRRASSVAGPRPSRRDAETDSLFDLD